LYANIGPFGYVVDGREVESFFGKRLPRSIENFSACGFDSSLATRQWFFPW
jgi:hypothetical protein